MNIIEIFPVQSVDEIVLNEYIDKGNVEVWDINENEFYHIEAELGIETRKHSMITDGIVDSGARKASGARNLFEKF
eukprot:snap_masked-scaffold_10-processed-gene-10.1-mRNA-1 protein AED:1.00 eAED:1.00 QI:0/-1/0/0/-1/1/1/0/75